MLLWTPFTSMIDFIENKKQALLKACLESWLCQLFLLITLGQEKAQEIVKSQNQDNGQGQKLIET